MVTREVLAELGLSCPINATAHEAAEQLACDVFFDYTRP